MSKPFQRSEPIALAQDTTPETKTMTIQVLRAGAFVDMHGTEFSITDEDLETYVLNSTAFLAQGEIPIELGHPDDSGAPASAWYRQFLTKDVDGVKWLCAEIELTALGADALAQNLYKYFSANVWLEDKIICGGGFVNRPAVDGQQPLGTLAATIKFVQPLAKTKEPAMKGKVPAALGRTLAKLEMSQEELARKLWDALREKYGDPNDEYSWDVPWVHSTYSEYVIVVKDGEYFKITYSFDGDNVVLGDAVKVEITWTPAETPSDTTAEESANLSEPVKVPAPIQLAIQSATAGASQGGTMSGSVQTPAPATPAPAPVIPPVATSPANVTAARTPSEVEAMVEQARSEERLAAQAQAAQIEAQLAAAREQERNRVMAELQRKEKVNMLVIKLTSGKRQFPYRPNDLGEALLKLSDADYEIVAPIFEKIQAAGLVDLGENGSAGHGMTPLKHLDPEQKAALGKYLKSGGKVEFFFKGNGLGETKEYDLSEFNIGAK